MEKSILWIVSREIEGVAWFTLLLIAVTMVCFGFFVPHPVDGMITVSTNFWLVTLGFVILFLFIIGMWLLQLSRERLREISRTYQRALRHVDAEDTLNELLTKRATGLEDIFLKQHETIAELPKSSLENGEERLDILTKRIATEKKFFWELHALVKTIGFTTRNSYKDYLPKPKPIVEQGGGIEATAL